MAWIVCTCGTPLEPPTGQDGGTFRCPQCAAAIELPEDKTAVAAKGMIPQYPSWREDREPLPHRPNVLAIIAFIFALSSFAISIAGSLPAMILGWLAKRKCDQDPLTTGRSLAGTAMSVAVWGTIANFVILMLIPRVQRVHEPSTHSMNMNNMKQLALAAHGYHDTFKRFPAAFGKQPGKDENHSAFIWMLPYLEQDALFRRPNDFPKGQDDVGKASVSLLIAPQDELGDREGKTSYAANLRVLSEAGAAAKPGDPVPLAETAAKPLSIAEIKDGTSFTFLFTNRFAECDGTFTLFDGMRPNEAGSPLFGAGIHLETADAKPEIDRVYQLKPSKRNCRADASIYGHALSTHGLMVAFCDGGVRMIKADVAPRLFQFGLCPNDGNQPNFD